MTRASGCSRVAVGGRGATPSRAPRFAALPPLSLYVHIPWCVRKCPYCDFNSHEARGDVPEDAYVDALLADLEFALPSVWGRKVGTVFIGGGTPSLFSAAAIDRLLAGDPRARCRSLPDAEITLEANPGHLRAREVRGLLRARASTGCRSACRASTPRTCRRSGACTTPTRRGARPRPR